MKRLALTSIRFLVVGAARDSAPIGASSSARRLREGGSGRAGLDSGLGSAGSLTVGSGSGSGALRCCFLC